jgi:16S rRNA processing protein RimM
LSGSQQFVAIARIVRPQGRRGEVLADILTDFPEKFSQRKQLWIATDESRRRECALENHWLHKGRVVLKFAGVNSISDAEALKGMLVEIPRELRSELEPGAAYVSDLIGSTVIDSSEGKSRKIGVVADVQQGVGTAPLLIVRDGRTDYDIPFAAEYMVRFDAAKRLLEMKLPEGMLDVNAPLSDSEKREQGKRE